MSHDFFDDLERQLVAAAGDRPRRLRRARARRVATMSTILVAVLAAGAGLAAAVTGGGDDARHGAPAGPGATTAPERTVAAAPATSTKTAPWRMTIAVLNGTTRPGMARGAANVLAHAGYKIGNVTNAATQDEARTTVYAAHAGFQAAAARIARALGGATILTGHGLAPAGLRVVAGEQADVIVLVGRDRDAFAQP
jgi:hypothetical protein